MPTHAIDLGNMGPFSNAIYNSITANSTSITSISVGGVSVNSTAFAGNANTATFANNANNLNGQPASYYTNATNITTGTLPMAQLNANVVNTSGSFTITGVYTYNANLVIGATSELVISNGAGIYANGSLGTDGQFLTSNGTGVYWANSSGFRTGFTYYLATS